MRIPSSEEIVAADAGPGRGQDDARLSPPAYLADLEELHQRAESVDLRRAGRGDPVVSQPDHGMGRIGRGVVVTSPLWGVLRPTLRVLGLMD